MKKVIYLGNSDNLWTQHNYYYVLSNSRGEFYITTDDKYQTARYDSDITSDFREVTPMRWRVESTSCTSYNHIYWTWPADHSEDALSFINDDEVIDSAHKDLFKLENEAESSPTAIKKMTWTGCDSAETTKGKVYEVLEIDNGYTFMNNLGERDEAAFTSFAEHHGDTAYKEIESKHHAIYLEEGRMKLKSFTDTGDRAKFIGEFLLEHLDNTDDNSIVLTFLGTLDNINPGDIIHVQ